MVKKLAIIGLLGISMVVMFRSEATAQYNYGGGGWDFCAQFGCSYHNSMTYTGVKGSDFNEFTILFLSNTVWYDNAQSCCVGKNCKNAPFEPGIGHFTLGGTVSPVLDALCLKRGKCTGTVVYPNSVADLQDPELFADCQAIVCDKFNLTEETDPKCSELTAQQCFNGLFFGSLANQNCRNKNDVVVEVRTKGVCTTATPKTYDLNGTTPTTEDDLECIDPNDITTCVCATTQSHDLSTCGTPQNDPVGVRYTFANFDQKPGDSFAQQLDDRCIACVANPDAVPDPCTP